MVRELLKCLQSSRAHKAILYSAGVVLMAAAILTAAGCYETDFEVVDASSAVAVHGLPGSYIPDAGGSLTISAVPHSNDYRFREVSKDNKVSTGYIRMVPLKGDIYIVQVKYDDEEGYILVFYQFTSDRHYKQMFPDVDDSRLYQLAEQHGVMLDLDFMYLDGSRSNIMAFLRAHVDLPFSSGQ